MPIVTFREKGDFSKLNTFFQKALGFLDLSILDKYGKKGVEALKAATPKDTGLASESWYYKIEREGSNVSLNWYNSDIEGGVNVAIILQYGHGTRNGGYVEGIDYINHALQPIFDEIAKTAWEEVFK